MTENMAENYEQVEFESEGATLRGRLYRPVGGTGDAPVIVMAHGFSVIATWLTDLATDYAAAGFTVLLFDHRNFGDSGGGKTWLALFVIGDLMKQGRDAILIDYEDHPSRRWQGLNRSAFLVTQSFSI